MWENWGDGEHAVGVVEQPAEAANEPAADPLPADATPTDASQLAEDQAPAPDAEAAQQDVPLETDEAHRTECLNTLQSEWGEAFNTHMEGVKSVIEQAPDFVRDYILGGRFDDGRAIANDSRVIKWLASLAPSGGRQVNQSAGDSNSLDAEIAQIESKIGTRAYVKDETMQARLRHLYAQRGR